MYIGGSDKSLIWIFNLEGLRISYARQRVLGDTTEPYNKHPKILGKMKARKNQKHKQKERITCRVVELFAPSRNIAIMYIEHVREKCSVICYFLVVQAP